MKITMFSINPLFSDVVMGGAPKHLQSIAIYMGQLGHDVTVLCTRTDRNPDSFQWHERVVVHPRLRFKQPFPQPYDTPAYNLASVLQDVGDALVQADRFYMHDGEFLFPYAYRQIPTVVSLRDHVYPETMLGGFLFQADRLILISEASRQYYVNTAGRFFPEFRSRVTVIPNGLNWERFRYTVPERILEFIPVTPDAQPIVLHPHRPEESKGIMQTIEVVDKLVHSYGFDNLIALAPRWHDVQTSPDLREFYTRVEHEIETRDLQTNFIFHDWIPQQLMPEYYSLGTVTLSLGHFVESFGNAVYESMGCGTPSIATRISTHRELMPDDLLTKVDYGDSDEAARIAAEIIRESRRTSAAAMAYLHTHFGVDRQLAAYASTILDAEIAEPLVYQHPTLDADTRYRLSPWCYVSHKYGIYHDYEADYLRHEKLLRLIDRHPEGFSSVEAARSDITPTEIDLLYRRGYLVPLVNP